MFRDSTVGDEPNTAAGWIRPGGLPVGSPALHLFLPEVLIRKRDISVWPAVVSPIQL